MKIKLLAVAALCVFGYLKTFSQEVNIDIEKAQSFPVASVVLKPSWIKQREDLNTRYIKSLDPDRLLHNFRVNANCPLMQNLLKAGSPEYWIERTFHRALSVRRFVIGRKVSRCVNKQAA